MEGNRRMGMVNSDSVPFLFFGVDLSQFLIIVDDFVL